MKQTVTYPLFSHAFFAYGDNLIRYIQVVLASEIAGKIIGQDNEFIVVSEFGYKSNSLAILLCVAVDRQ